MNRLLSKQIILLALTSLVSFVAVAQFNAIDSNFYQKSVSNIISYYHLQLAPEKKLYDGIEYIPYDYRITRGSPYFQSGKYNPGYIVYHNVLFENIPLMYDLVRGVVIIRSPDQRFSIELNNENLSGFGVAGHHFVHIQKDSVSNAPVTTGFYDLLYNGKLRVWKKQTKTIQEEHSGSSIEEYIEESTRYFIEKDGGFYPANSESPVLALMKDKKREIRQFIKTNKIKFGKDKDQALVKMAAYYDEITN